MEQHRLLVELRILVGAQRGAEADPVRTLHRLDLDHVGAHRREPRGRDRPGPERGEVDDGDARQRTVADRTGIVRSRTPATTAASPASAGAIELAIGHAVEAERRTRANPRLAWLREQYVALAQVVEPRQLGAVADDRRRYPRLDARGDDLLRGVRGRQRVERGIHLLGAHEAAEHRAELAVFGHVVAADHASACHCCDVTVVMPT